MAWWRRTLLGLCAVAASSFPALAGSNKGDAPDGPPPPPPGSFAAVIANNPISAILQGPRLWTTPADPLPWVKATRPKKEQDFMPVGLKPSKHPLPVRSAAELAADKADLDRSETEMQGVLAQKPVLAPMTPPPVVGPPPKIGQATADPRPSDPPKVDQANLDPADAAPPPTDVPKKGKARADKTKLDKARLKKLSKVKPKPPVTAD
jgi:hypothetical protein